MPAARPLLTAHPHVEARTRGPSCLRPVGGELDYHPISTMPWCCGSLASRSQGTGNFVTKSVFFFTGLHCERPRPGPGRVFLLQVTRFNLKFKFNRDFKLKKFTTK